MIHTITGTHEDSIGQMIAGWFNQNSDSTIQPPYSAMAWRKDNTNSILDGECVFTDYTGSNIEIHLYAPMCMNRKTIKDVYNYVFKQLKCNRLTAKPYYTNEKLLRLLPRLGFEYEGKLKDYYGPAEKPIDALIYKLTKNNASRWI